MTWQERILADKLADYHAWLEARRPVATASEIGVIIRGGAARAQLLAEKRSGAHKDLSSIPAIAHGNSREAPIAEWAAAKWPGLEVSEALVHAPGEPRFAATCDLVGPGMIREIKTGKHAWEDTATAEKYRDQVLWQMLCLDIRDAAILFEQHEDGVPVGFEPSVIPIEWDAVRVIELVEAARLFLDDLDGDEAEPDFDADVDAIAMAYLAAFDREKDRTKEKKAYWSQLQERLEGRGPVSQETPWARVTYSVSEKTKPVIDEAAARAADPDLAARWDALLAAHTTTETVTDERLTVTRPKEKK